MMFELRDLVLATIAGVIIGAYLVGARAAHRSERPLARLLAAFIEPIVYWADLRGPDGRPSHSKVAYFSTLIVALAGLILFGQHELTHGGEIHWGFVAYTALVLLYALGRHAYLGFLQSRVGDRLASAIGARASGGYSTPARQSQPTIAEEADQHYDPSNGDPSTSRAG